MSLSLLLSPSHFPSLFISFTLSLSLSLTLFLLSQTRLPWLLLSLTLTLSHLHSSLTHLLSSFPFSCPLPLTLSPWTYLSISSSEWYNSVLLERFRFFSLALSSSPTHHHSLLRTHAHTPTHLYRSHTHAFEYLLFLLDSKVFVCIRWKDRVNLYFSPIQSFSAICSSHSRRRRRRRPTPSRTTAKRGPSFFSWSHNNVQNDADADVGDDKPSWRKMFLWLFHTFWKQKTLQKKWKEQNIKNKFYRSQEAKFYTSSILDK